MIVERRRTNAVSIQGFHPMLATNVATMSNTDRFAEVLRRSKRNFKPDVVRAIDSLLEPSNLVIVTGTGRMGRISLFWRRRGSRHLTLGGWGVYDWLVDNGCCH